VKQSRTTVTYRFSEPNQPMPLVLPQSYLQHWPGNPNSGGAADRRRSHQEEAARAETAPKRRREANWRGQDQRLQLGGESVQPGNPVHARDHRLPWLRSAPGGGHDGRAVDPSTDKLGAFAEGGCRTDWRGPRHVGKVGAGEEGTGERVPGAGGAVPPGRDASEGATSGVARMLESMELPTRRSVRRLRRPMLCAPVDANGTSQE
jgi:hypothetical protein